ncbi:MAG: glutamate--tRNA ligase [Candidatus Doudnabacteria bacterium]
MNTQQVRTRFAPSPTGYVHIGSLRTALFAFLYARHFGGVNVLRIEDTDQTRKVDGAIENLLQVMQALGVSFDEGVVLDDDQLKQEGEYGPYIQSERLEIYKEYSQKLLDQGKAYFCYCSPQRLTELRAEQTALKKPPMYDGACRYLTQEEREQKLEELELQGLSPVIRQKIPKDGITVLQDLIYGEIKYDNALLDDHILIKSDGFPTYHFAVVVDDHLMQITHVIRGEEWVPSTPKHILLYEAFGWDAPKFAHLPLILNPDKSKLSKRQGDVSLEDFLSKGYLPEALVNFIAFLGWNPKTEQELFSMDDLIANFDLVKVNKSGAVFDPVKLDWMNSLYIRQKSNQQILELVKPFLLDAQVKIEDYDEQFLLAIIEIEKDRLKILADITKHIDYYFAVPEYDSSILIWKKADAPTTLEVLTKLENHLKTFSEEQWFSLDMIESSIKQWIGDNGYDNGTVLWPLRVALSGLERSPNPFELLWVLYKKGQTAEDIFQRISQAISKLG